LVRKKDRVNGFAKGLGKAVQGERVGGIRGDP